LQGIDCRLPVFFTDLQLRKGGGRKQRPCSRVEKKFCRKRGSKVNGRRTGDAKNYGFTEAGGIPNLVHMGGFPKKGS